MSTSDLSTMAAELMSRGVRRVHVLAWRDLDDPDAGGSEVHADEFMRRWAASGLEVTHRTSAAVDRPEISERNGYHVIRRGGRMAVFPRTIVGEVLRTMGPYDAVVENWNGVPWLSPVWCRKPRVLVLHHIHGPMWNRMFPAPIAAVGRILESRLAPPFYRSTPTVTTSDDTLTELVELGWRTEQVVTGPVGVDDFFCSDPTVVKTQHPSVLAVGRQAPVKRFPLLLEQMKIARASVPGARLTLVGDGPERANLERWVADNDASSWVEFAGRVDRERLRDLYRRSWLVSSASLAEGWGLALTEAAGCGTPAVATDISGHRCSVIDGSTGLLAPVDRLGSTIARVLTDDELRRSLSERAEARARTLTWDALATGLMRPLHAQVVERSAR
ncbi:MAG: glycosyltransferase family 4 protein [Actinomycetota bacterium]